MLLEKFATEIDPNPASVHTPIEFIRRAKKLRDVKRAKLLRNAIHHANKILGQGKSTHAPVNKKLLAIVGIPPLVGAGAALTAIALSNRRKK